MNPTRASSLLVFAVVCLIPTFFSVPTFAQEAPPASEAAQAKPTAADHKAAGDAAMQRLEYQAALDAYDRAYALEPNPALLYNRGRALQALGKRPEALDQLEAFDREASADLKARVPKLAELISELRAQVSSLSLTSNVAGARVLVRGRMVGTTPLRPFRLNAGSASVEVVAEGHHPYKTNVTLPGGKTHTLHAVLHSKNTTGVLEITSPVPGALVFVNGSRVGSAPAQTVLRAGEHRVVVRHEGYDESETSAVVKAGATTRLDVPLDRPPAVTERWWFWTGVGVVIVAGAVVTYALLTERDPDEGDIPPGQVSGPLRLSF